MRDDQTTAAARDMADGLKLALKELADEEPETLRKFLLAVFEHLSDGASTWAGKKLLTLIAAMLFGAGLWLISKLGGFK